MKGFKAFLLRGNVVELAVAVVIGVAFGLVVTAFVKDLVTPLVAALFGKPDFGALTFTVNSSKFLYGDFINAVLAFLIVAAVIYFRCRKDHVPGPPDGANQCVVFLGVGAWLGELHVVGDQAGTRAS